VKQPQVVLNCEHPGCLAVPTKAPRIYCPAKGIGTENHQYDPVSLAFPHLHYCQKHWDEELKLDNLLDDKAKARLEDRGRKIWPQGIRCDFDAALIQPINVHSPEYGQYMERIGLSIDGLGYSLWGTMERRRG